MRNCVKGLGITGLQLSLSTDLWFGSRAPVSVGLCLSVAYLSGVHKFVLTTFFIVTNFLCVFTLGTIFLRVQAFQ